MDQPMTAGLTKGEQGSELAELVNQFIAGKVPMTAALAAKFASAFGGEASFWTDFDRYSRETKPAEAFERVA
jgi:plasmid maintenance system antidote protein VapI